MSEYREWECHHGNVVETANGYDAVDCATCGFIHVVPIPSSAELGEFYRQKFYQQKANYFASHQEDLAWWNAIYLERYERFERHHKGHPGRILDVGSGPGNFLKLGQQRGWDVVGVEPSMQAAEYARSLGLTIINSSFGPELAPDLGRFDVVYMHGVMEHLRDPIATTALCYQLLNPGGLLFVNVANDFSPFQKILRRSGYPPWWFVPPEHLNYFSVDSLRQLLTKAGFVEQHVMSSFPIDMFLLMGDNYIADGSVGKACHNRRKQFEFALINQGYGDLRAKLYEALAGLNIGREIDMTVMKPWN